jgi:hypothetical protein
MRIGEGLRNETILAALDRALRDGASAADADALYKHLGLASGLPGPRANLGVASAFATECAARGKKADRLLFEMVRIPPDSAPGATAREFLPVCGVLGLGARAAADESVRKKVLAALHDAAEDPRFRVRDAVPLALARIGEKAGASLAAELAPWMDGYHQAAAAILGLAEGAWLPSPTDDALARLDEAYALARDAPRAAVRWPGWKALVDALGKAPAALAARFGVPIFDRLAAWADTAMPELRDAVESNLRSSKLARYADEVARVRAALGASLPPPRDPTRIVQGMRSRSKKRGRHRR